MPRKKKNSIDELDALHAEAHRQNEIKKEFGRELRQAREEVQALIDQRGRLIYNDPALVDHNGQAVDPKNAVAEVDRALEKGPDLEDLQRRYDHQAAIVEKARLTARNFTNDNSRTLFGDHRPEAEAAAEKAAQARDVFLEALAEYRVAWERSIDIGRDVPDMDDRDVPGGEVRDLAHNLAAFDFPAPVPDLEPEVAYVIHDPHDSDIDHKEALSA